MVQNADPFAELRLESGGLQNRRQELVVHPIEGLGLIQIDQRGLVVVFYPLYDLANQVQVVLDRSSLHSVVLLRSNQITNDKLQMIC